MSHLSEYIKKINYEYVGNEIKTITPENNNIWFLSLPYINKQNNNKIAKDLISFLNKAKSNTTVMILTSPYFAAFILSSEEHNFKQKLWIGIESNGLPQVDGQLHNKHAALIILSNDNNIIKHSKTRIGYTFCPQCNKTTKDYGGKKHLYHEFGTLMSDVWKDFTFDYYGSLETLIDRVTDLFGIPPFNMLYHIDMRNCLLEPITKGISVSKEFQINTINESVLLNGDCLEKLAEIPDNSIDFCFVDPPYNIKKKYESWDDSIDIQEYFNWCDKWLTELARIIKPNRTVAILNIPQWAVRHFKHLNKTLEFQDWIIWDAMGLPVRMIMPSHYSILCFSKGKSNDLPGIIRQNHSSIEYDALRSLKKDYCIRASCVKIRNKNKVIDKEPISNIWSDIHRLKHNSKRVDHPTQLPPQLMYRLISLFTNENEVVLDCFNGSGTTTLCSEILNRRYIGIELSNYYYDISINRHNELKNNVDPFRKNDETPNVKNNNVGRVLKQKYEVDKKTLQLEVKKISKLIKKIPSREDVINHTKYKIEYFDNYFSNWSEVTAAARTTGMEEVENKDHYLKRMNN
ncbi:DNA-methyltransferase [Elizabethkingia meningoseptica]|uniref:DNA-methyltransferase n=1 Tax=Elizabethkingia meningoseptica TaxID=238 RepID=UPI0023AEF8ED|nr:site-specific DNA-methyltransferase [Elizabethkingia meningoseptica]MDE5527939.1 site-specific DNA-methyltransferase [Elizabethkingia meningoseptica]